MLRRLKNRAYFSTSCLLMLLEVRRATTSMFVADPCRVAAEAPRSSLVHSCACFWAVVAALVFRWLYSVYFHCERAPARHRTGDGTRLLGVPTRLVRLVLGTLGSVLVLWYLPVPVPSSRSRGVVYHSSAAAHQNLFFVLDKLSCCWQSHHPVHHVGTAMGASTICCRWCYY